jgi:hypothetical protein
MTMCPLEATRESKSNRVTAGRTRCLVPALSVALITACGAGDRESELAATSQSLAEQDEQTAVEFGPGFDFIEFGAGLDETTVPADEAEPLDVDLQFALDNGFQSFLFAQTCLSVGADGSVLEGDPLPVGGGRQLECETAPIAYLKTIDIQASTGEPFCALGLVSSFVGDGDARLAVSVASAPDGAPRVHIGTSDAAGN